MRITTITLSDPGNRLRPNVGRLGEFGRETSIEQLVHRLARTRFLAVVGPSGSGKSSVVRAGLVPAIRGGALEGSERWGIAEMFPGAYPLEDSRLRCFGWRSRRRRA